MQGNSSDFHKLIHKVRPDLNRVDVGLFFVKLIEDGLLAYDEKEVLVWVK